jgi:hypothetical protein
MINTAKVAPAGVGATGAGASTFGTATQQNTRYKASRLPVCFRYYLGRSGEADARRAHNAALLHHRLHFI